MGTVAIFFIKSGEENGRWRLCLSHQTKNSRDRKRAFGNENQRKDKFNLISSPVGLLIFYFNLNRGQNTYVKVICQSTIKES